MNIIVTTKRSCMLKAAVCGMHRFAPSPIWKNRVMCRPVWEWVHCIGKTPRSLKRATSQPACLRATKGGGLRLPSHRDGNGPLGYLWLGLVCLEISWVLFQDIPKMGKEKLLQHSPSHYALHCLPNSGFMSCKLFAFNCRNCRYDRTIYFVFVWSTEEI